MSRRQPLAPLSLPADAIPANPAHMPPSQAHLFAKVISPEGPYATSDVSNDQKQDRDVQKYSWSAEAVDAAGNPHPLGPPGVNIHPAGAAGRGRIESDASSSVAERAIMRQARQARDNGEQHQLVPAGDPATGGSEADYPSHPDEPRSRASRSTPKQAADTAAAHDEHRELGRPACDAPGHAPHASPSAWSQPGNHQELAGRGPCAASWVTLQGAQTCAHCSSRYVAFGLAAGGGSASGPSDGQAWRSLYCATCLRGELDTRCLGCTALAASRLPLF